MIAAIPDDGLNAMRVRVSAVVFATCVPPQPREENG